MTTNTTHSIGFIGGGNMARSIIGGLVPDIIDSRCIHVFDPNLEQLNQLQEQFNVVASASNEDLITHCDVIVLAVKPQAMSTVLSPISTALCEKSPLIISIAAGITNDLILQTINKSCNSTQSNNSLAIIRVMPNTPALVKAGASGMYANKYVTSSQKEIADTLLSAVGSAVWVENEIDIDAVTALSGSGPAYFMLFIKSLIESAEQAGLSHTVAKQLAIDTCAGSAKLIQNSDTDITQLIKNVTSPGGTTEQALLSFKNNELPLIIDKAFQAALKRSIELGTELSKDI